MEKVMLQRENRTTTKSSSFFKPNIQKKLSVGSANDSYEVEADTMANKVMRMSEPSNNNITTSGTSVQKKCTACEHEEKIQKKSLSENITPLIQRVSNSESGGQAPSHVESQINSSRGSGSSLDHGTKNFMETRFGTDFSAVKIHTGSQAVQMSRELNAQAFTVGNDIYFNEGKYSPNSDSGKHLLAHELTHTVQQTGGIGKKIQKSANTCTYGEIRAWAITSLRDHSSPAGLADAKASIGSVCTSRNCHCVDGSEATAPGDAAAWTNIVAANGGTDLSGGGNFMCVGTQECGFVHRCRPSYRQGEPRPPMQERETNLTPSGTAVVNGHTLYFYSDSRNGNCP